MTILIFPSNQVLVLRADTNVIYDRLQARGYSKKKLDENMECEIMQVVLEAARDSYAHEIVQELQSNDTDDMDANEGRVEGWLAAWVENNK